VTVVKAENLSSLDCNGLSDPYGILSFVAPEAPKLASVARRFAGYSESFSGLKNMMGFAPSLHGAAGSTDTHNAETASGKTEGCNNTHHAPAGSDNTQHAADAAAAGEVETALKSLKPDSYRAVVRKNMEEPAHISNALKELKKSNSKPTLSTIDVSSLNQDAESAPKLKSTATGIATLLGPEGFSVIHPSP